MCKHTGLHLNLECRAPQCRNRQMEIFKCDVNFKDIWKIVVRIRTHYHILNISWPSSFKLPIGP
jgi:hypothetical protein